MQISQTKNIKTYQIHGLQEPPVEEMKCLFSMNLTNLKNPLLIIDVEIVHYIFNGVLCIIL